MNDYEHSCLSVCLSVWLTICLSLVWLSVCVSICPSVCLSLVCLSVCLFLWHFIFPSQVFQKVEVSIKVKEGRAGARRLVIGLVANGRDFAEDGGAGVSIWPYTFLLAYVFILSIFINVSLFVVKIISSWTQLCIVTFSAMNFSHFFIFGELNLDCSFEIFVFILSHKPVHLQLFCNLPLQLHHDSCEQIMLGTNWEVVT